MSVSLYHVIVVLNKIPRVIASGSTPDETVEIIRTWLPRWHGSHLDGMNAELIRVTCHQAYQNYRVQDPSNPEVEICVLHLPVLKLKLFIHAV